ncbi:DUF4012 domain-containing protein [Microbacterium marinilacus]|uniref:DUF4012 domain-containing protein n=1 Tax=Microbacterium marinilacus TaxID=415209 RepID=A0ABP7BDW4_9MICO|nr:DUF4012 domain-containing protein [Microbacterium marinilacus]MBY0690184.1 DUF4012 domain-containing protein [Microbacterium marinilacus]
MAESRRSAAPDDATAILDLPQGEAPVERRRRRPVGRIVTVTIVVVVILLLLAAVWLAFRAITVKNELESAQGIVAELQDGADVRESLDSLGRHAGAAADAAGDPIWRLAEVIPFAGPNLQGVRLAAESLDVVANRLAVPAYDALEAESDEPVLGRILPAVDDATPEIVDLAEQVADIRESDALISQVRDGLDMVAPVMSGAADALPLLPELLGGNGARNYLLISQNNAESVGLGGSAASQTLLHVENGSIEIAGQASSDSYRDRTPVDVEVPDNALALYSDYLLTYINTSASRPDFPTMAEIAIAHWNREIGQDQIDGVISIDPIALGFMLEATGPVQLETGEDLTADTAVDRLLNGIYLDYGQYWQAQYVDAFFASAAVSIFDKLSTGDFDAMKMAGSIGEGIDGGHVMFWSANDEVQSQVAPLRVSGILPEDNDESTAVGVYFRDESMSKIDYYMKSAISVDESCADGQRRFTTSATLNLDIPQAEANVLPQYIRSGHWGAEKFRTQVYLYGPHGTTVDSVSVDGRLVTEVQHDLDDLGRPVAWFTVELAPTESGTVTATFVGEDGEYGPLEVRSTPMVNETDVETSGEGCSAR